MSKKTRVLHVLGNMSIWGGIETWLLNVVRRGRKDEFQHDFAYMYPPREPAPLDKELVEHGVRILPCPLDPPSARGARTFRRNLEALLDAQEAYDAIHSHSWAGSGYVLKVADVAGIPTRIAHSHSTPSAGGGFKRTVQQWLLRRWIDKHATHMIGCSQLAGRSLFRAAVDTDPRYQTLFYGVDLAPFEQLQDRDAACKEFGIPVDAKIVGTAGRCAEQKNQVFLLEFMAEAMQRDPDVWLLLLGDGPLLAERKAQARALGIEDRVVFAGHRDDVTRVLMSSMDLFALPSLYEGLPVAFIEAQASGLPCVMSNTITDEVVSRPEATSRLALEDPVGDWAEAVLSRLQQPRDTDAARKLRGTPYDADFSVARIEAVYKG